MEDASVITSLPDDPQALKQIILNLSRERDDWHVKFLRVETELLRLRKWYYGPRADRLQTPGDVAQMLLGFGEQMESRPVNQEDLPADVPEAEVKSVRRVRRGRRNLAAFENLPVTRKEHDLPEDQKRCPCCSEMRQRIGQETSWQVEFIPGHFERLEHARFKYACKHCEQNAENPYNLFYFTLGRGRDGPATFLKGYKQTLVADAYGGYDGVVVGNDITRAGCMAHARRKFVDAEKTHPAIAAEAVGLIRQLYAVEEQAKGKTNEDRLCLRQSQSQPILLRLCERLWAWKEQLLPKHPMAEAINYTLNQWNELNVFTTDGAVPIDNNVSEREMKRICLNRKNSLFVGNERGGQTAAILSSLTSTCRRHNIDPQRYLTQLLTNLPVTPISQLEQWLPDRWKQKNKTLSTQ